MIRLLIVVLIIALSLTMIMRKMEGDTPRDAPSSPEDTMIGRQLDPLNKAQQFSEDYGDALDEQRKDLDEAIDDG